RGGHIVHRGGARVLRTHERDAEPSTMMDARFLVKVLAVDATGVAPKEFIAIFHRWIQESVLDELTIDVADYSHVHHGPGVILVSQEAHYSTDQAGGRLGLQYERKRGSGRLGDAVQRAFKACDQLEREPSLAKRLRFARDELIVGINDRLVAPNTT